MVFSSYRKGRGVCAVLVCVGLLFAVPGAWAQKELRVAAAADLQPVMPVLAQSYEHATGVKLVVSFGSSSTLATQILNGAPMDIFLAADFTYPEKIVAAGLADGTSPVAYAKGKLVQWDAEGFGFAAVESRDPDGPAGEDGSR